MNRLAQSVIAVALKFSGTESVTALKSSVGDLRNEFQTLTQSFAAGLVGPEKFTAEAGKLSREIERQTRLLNQLEAAQASAEAATKAQAAATATAAGTASAWGNVIAHAAEQADKATQAIRDREAADRSAVQTFNQLTPLITIQAAELAKLEAAEKKATAARLASIANTGAAGPAWGAVTANAAEQAERAAKAIRDKAAADAEAVRTANQLIPLVVIQSGELAKLTDAEKKAAASAEALRSAEKAMGSGATATATDLQTLRTRLDQADAEMRSLSASFLQGKISADAYKAGLDRINSTAAPLRAVQSSLDGVASRTSGLTQTVRGAGAGLSDVFANNGPLGQRIQGFANNISQIGEGIARSLGKTGPAVFAAVASVELLTTAFGALLTAFKIKTVEDFFALFTGKAKQATGSVKELEERIQELTEKPHLIPVEMRELDNAKKRVDEIKAALDAVNRLESSQTDTASKSGKAVGEAVREAKDDTGKPIGAQGVKDALRAQIVREMLDQVDKAADREIGPLLKRVEELRKLRATASGVEEIESVNALLIPAVGELGEAQARNAKNRAAVTTPDGDTPARADQELGRIFNGAEKGAGDQQRNAQTELARRARKAGLNDLAAGVEDSAPEKVAERELRKKVDEKLQKLREVLQAAGDSEESADDALAELANATDAQLDATIKAAQKRAAADRAVKAKAAKLTADLNAQGNEIERDTRDEFRRQGRPLPAPGADIRADRKNEKEQARDEAQTFDRSVDRGVKAAESTDLDEAAEAFAARLKADGGIRRNDGKLQRDGSVGSVERLDQAQQFDALLARLNAAIERRFPGVDRDQRETVAARMALDATGRADQRAALARAGLGQELDQRSAAAGVPVPQLVGARGPAQAEAMVAAEAARRAAAGAAANVPAGPGAAPARPTRKGRKPSRPRAPAPGKQPEGFRSVRPAPARPTRTGPKPPAALQPKPPAERPRTAPGAAAGTDRAAGPDPAVGRLAGVQARAQANQATNAEALRQTLASVENLAAAEARNASDIQALARQAAQQNSRTRTQLNRGRR